MGRRHRLRKGAAQERAHRQGGTVVPLSPMTVPPTDPGDTREGWFGPLAPQNPSAPVGLAGRRNDFRSGYNITYQPRADHAVSFADLRALSRGYDLLRLVIETRKDQMARLTWSISPRDVTRRKKTDDTTRARCLEVEALFRRPDRRNFWGDWLRSVLEDLLVIDAPAIHVRRTMDGLDIWSLDQIDGATIKPVIDEYGRTPEPPYCAYQQILKGIVAFSYSTQDLIYRPRNTPVWDFYGYSPVEQIIMTVNIALRRQMWQLAYFTHGNIPDSLIGVPSTWTPDQIRQFQDWFDSLLAGNSQMRRGAVFVPGEVAKSYTPTKDAEIFGAAEEWLARVTCFAFGVSHQALVKEVNRSTADNAAQQALEDGLSPVMAWVKNLVDTILLDQMGIVDLEFVWEDDKELDQKVQQEILTSYSDSAILTKNEVRNRLGEDPFPDPEANILMAKTATGYVPLSSEEAIRIKKASMEAFPAPSPVAPGEGVPSGGEEDTPPPRSDVSKSCCTGSWGSFSKSAGEAGSAGPTRPLARRAQRSLARSLAPVLRTTGDDVAAQVEVVLARRGVRKSDDEMTDDEISTTLDEIMSGLDLSSMEVITDLAEPDLLRVAEDSGREALARVGLGTSSRDVFERVNTRAVAYARDRSAEMVGMRTMPDGTTVANPSARWAITDSTREAIRSTIETGLRDNLGSDFIVESLQESFSFSPERADMVSRTEIAMANSEGAMDGYRAARDAGVSLRKEWILGENPCPVCEANAEQGPIDLDEDFDSGDDTAPAHPNCECAVVPVVDSGDGGDN